MIGLTVALALLTMVSTDAFSLPLTLDKTRTSIPVSMSTSSEINSGLPEVVKPPNKEEQLEGGLKAMGFITSATVCLGLAINPIVDTSTPMVSTSTRPIIMKETKTTIKTKNEGIKTQSTISKSSKVSPSALASPQYSISSMMKVTNSPPIQHMQPALGVVPASSTSSGGRVLPKEELSYKALEYIQRNYGTTKFVDEVETTTATTQTESVSTAVKGRRDSISAAVNKKTVSPPDAASKLAIERTQAFLRARENTVPRNEGFVLGKVSNGDSMTGGRVLPKEEISAEAWALVQRWGSQ